MPLHSYEPGLRHADLHRRSALCMSGDRQHLLQEITTFISAEHKGALPGEKDIATRIEGQHRWLTWSDLHTEHHTLHNLSHHYISGIRLLGPVPTAASLKCHRRACTRNPARQKPVDFRARGHWSRPFVERDFKRRACLPRDPFYAGTSQALKRSGILETQKEQRSCRWASARDEPAGKLC